MTSSRLSVADVAGEVPRIAARAVLAFFPLGLRRLQPKILYALAAQRAAAAAGMRCHSSVSLKRDKARAGARVRGASHACERALVRQVLYDAS